MSKSVIGVVGAGPVGSLAALELARRGLNVILLEARSEISWTSRAICISRRSMEILDRAGVGEAFQEKGLPWSKGKTFHRGQLVFRLELPHAAEDRHAPFINLQQCYTEQFLVDAIGAEASIDLRWGHCLTKVSQNADQVLLEVEGPDGSYTLAADWLVAADGARSAVRRSLGLSMNGTSYEGRYLISDVEVEATAWPVERHVWFDPPANRGSTVILHVQPDGIWRIDMQLYEDEDPETALRDENLLPRLQAQLDTMGVAAPWRLVWKSIYRAHSLSLDSYRHGRVLFAGDAAHLVPIFGVRGLNSGFDDAHNLAWKLAMVAQGDAPDELLESYSAERRRATAENIANAEKSTWFMSPPTRGFWRMRDAALTLAHENEWARSLINPRQASFHVYDSSPVVLLDEAAEIGVRPGAPIPNLPFKGGHLQGALARTRFSALVFEDCLPPGSASQVYAACGELGIVPIIVPGATHQIALHFAAARFPLYLIRPDEHVAARLKADDLFRVAAAYRVATGHVGAGPRSKLEIAMASPLERIYESLSHALDAAEASGDRLSLERLALALANQVADPAIALDWIDRASKSQGTSD
jgi:3-(3-hydroxy-phenyl)propionate hydroxylase